MNLKFVHFIQISCVIPVLLSVSEEYNLLRYLKKYDILNNDYKYKNNKKGEL